MICDKSIAQTCGACSHKKPTSDYTEVEIAWTNGAKMKIGVCVACAVSHVWNTPDAKKQITQAHFDHWNKVGASYDKEIVVA